jgi:hypothetical protein
MHTLLTWMQICISIIVILLQDVSKRREREKESEREREITKDVLIISFMNN